MAKIKSPGDDCLTKEFYEILWNKLKIPFIHSLRKSFLKEQLSNSQKQAVIRLIEKKTKIKALQTLHVYSTLKRRGNERFHVVSTWNTRRVFVGRFIQNCRPLPLLNTDVKILLKVMAQRLKQTLPLLISANQSAYVDGRFISEVGRLISDLLEISDKLKLDSLLATIDIQKAFDFVDHSFLISTLERYGFGNKFVK